MARQIIWLCGCVGLLYLAYRFSVWHLLWQIFIVFMLFAWVILGAYLVGHKQREVRRTAQDRAELFAETRAAAERANYAARFGEDKAAQIDHNDPQFWRRVTTPRVVAK
jgi:hypothetical protein